MEEKKNNKGLIIGLIIFLVLCLIAIFYFIFKMIYIEPTNNNINEIETSEINNESQTNEEIFTELTKYELNEGEEKEITISGKKIVIKILDGNYYVNNNNIGKGVYNKNTYNIYTTNEFIILPYVVGQSGDKLYIYDTDGKKIEVDDKGGEDAQYTNIRYKNGRIFMDTGAFGDGLCTNESQCFYEKIDIQCLNEKYKEIKEYEEELEKYKNDQIYTTTYEIKYKEEKVTIQKAEDINTIEKWIETYDKVCIKEE